ncbi:MAG: TPM domain-containing protein, partial [Deltaproteobacteria bacterium]|nr:TPM domain-containing protein [Deltaproteobacteria bacterium]
MAPAIADEVPIPPAPARFVTDEAGFLSARRRDALERALEEYGRKRGHQLLVWIGQTTGDTPLEDWTIRAFEAWRPGRRGIDDGLVLFVFARDRRIRIEVGYGLEGVVTDAVSGRIIREVMAPRIRADDRDGAVTGAVQDLMATIGGPVPIGPHAQRAPRGAWRPDRLSPAQIVLVILVGVLFLILFITNPALALLLLANLFSGGRAGGGGG